ncbi:putative aminohydrolase SsnA [Clostridium intestinale]|uniref:Putative selenium metabolism protein SsnA n=1 Tax=Clostridium intestinale DSM 6191 TaxID=1121320 RepID=A0A1M5YI70_9CLOT|nr:putative aminohydrolase SsnA [Clostridium intestinale]SHI11203.1 putative selenium metabolism protein SsnA [Clostridium intestinale DSM 6191]
MIIGNGRVITRDDENPYIENGAVVIRDNTIIAVGDYSVLKEKYKEEEFIDAKGKVIMPGLINTHMHIYSAFARGMAGKGPAPKNFTDILENLWWRLDKGLTLEDTKYSAYTTYLDCIKNGVTTVFDHHASPYSVEGSLFTIGDAAKELGVRTCLCYETSDRDGEEILKAGIKENINFIKKYNNVNEDMLKGMFGMHAAFTLSDKSLDMCREAMEGVDAGYHIHTSEGIDDLYDSLRNHGKRVVERLMDFDILSDKTIAVHCVHVNSREMELLKQTNTNVVHNPESNMGNAVGCSPVLEFIERGINVGLGTDGYTSDMMESIKVGNIIHKHNLCDPNVGFNEVSSMAFDNNRKISSKYFNKEVGALKEGAYGDVIIVDYNPLTPLNENNINGHIIFGMSGRCVTDTIINGKVVMRNRVINKVDEEKIFSKSRELAQKLWERI